MGRVVIAIEVKPRRPDADELPEKTMSIEAEIKDVVLRNLPQAVGAVLLERLNQADAAADKVKLLQETAESLRCDKESLKREVNRLQNELDKHGDLTAREGAVAERERNAELFELKAQLQAAVGNTQFAKDVALGLVRNIEYRSSVMETVTGKSHAVNGGNGCSGFVSQASYPETTSVSESRSAT